jgi:D-alanyl-D-alanine carboxypeptidase (penicillin-binding protein 5/6)
VDVVCSFLEPVLIVFERFSYVVCCCFVALVLGLLPAARAADAPPSQIDAKAWALLDVQSGQLVTGYQYDERFAPASLTKLMSAYLVFEALRQRKIKWDQIVSVSDKARRANGSRMFIDVNKPVSVSDLLRGMIIQSGNDATLCLAETVAGTEEAFVVLMNQQAKRLSLTNTHFTNASGLPEPSHTTSARDLALLTAAIIRDFPDFYTLYSEKQFRYNNITQLNRNRLLWRDPTVDGVKTGHTEAAGYCLISSAKRDGRRLIAVVLGADSDASRAEESQRLLNYGFLNFDTVRVYAPLQAVSRPRVWKGNDNVVNLGFPNGLYVTVPKGEASHLSATAQTLQPLLAPLRSGQPVGTLNLQLNGKAYESVPLYVLQDVPVAGVFGRLWDAFLMYFR